MKCPIYEQDITSFEKEDSYPITTRTTNLTIRGSILAVTIGIAVIIWQIFQVLFWCFCYCKTWISLQINKLTY